MPGTFTAVWTQEHDVLELDCEVIDSSLVCVALRVSINRDAAHPVNAQDVRLPLSSIMKQVAAHAVLPFELVEPGHYRSKAVEVASGDLTAPRGRTVLTDAFLRSVAEEYAAAVKAGANPTAAVHAAAPKLSGHAVSRSTAGRWVVEARRKGLLPATEQRRARA